MSTTHPQFDVERNELERLIVDHSFSRPQQADQVSAESDVAAKLLTALDSPIDYPKLSESVFPGDSVVIVIQPDLPEAAAILKSLVDFLVQNTSESNDISVVLAEKTAEVLGVEASNESSTSSTSEFGSIRFKVHDPTDNEEVAYLAANKEGLPVVVSRTIFDADVVIPLGFPVARSEETHKLMPVDRSIYPAFSDTDTIKRFNKSDEYSELDGEVRMVNSNLGVFSTIQVVPGPAGTVRQIHSGEQEKTCTTAQDQFANIWTIAPPANADLAVVTIDSEPATQSWDDIAKALLVADELVPGQSPIVIWSQLKKKPGSDFRLACAVPFEESATSKPELPLQLTRVSEILSDRRVFLHSQLDQAEVEQLGIGFVSKASDLSRMIGDASAGLYLQDAHRCLVATETGHAY